MIKSIIEEYAKLSGGEFNEGNTATEMAGRSSNFIANFKRNFRAKKMREGLAEARQKVTNVEVKRWTKYIEDDIKKKNKIFSNLYKLPR